MCWVLSGPQVFMNSLVSASHLPIGIQGLQTRALSHQVLYMGSGDLDSDHEAHTESALPTESS